MQKSPKQKLFEIAELQGGFFTAKQAVSAGYSNPTHTYHVRNQDWLRIERGIYRLSYFPIINEREDLIILFLWSCDRSGIPQGTFSYQTALDVLGGTDIMPVKVHMTVPKGFRRSTYPPELELHFENLKDDEIELYKGLRVTTSKKTLEDLFITQMLDSKTWIEACDHLLGPMSSANEKWIKKLEKVRSSKNI